MCQIAKKEHSSELVSSNEWLSEWTWVSEKVSKCVWKCDCVCVREKLPKDSSTQFESRQNVNKTLYAKNHQSTCLRRCNCSKFYTFCTVLQEKANHEHKIILYATFQEASRWYKQRIDSVIQSVGSLESEVLVEKLSFEEKTMKLMCFFLITKKKEKNFLNY